MIRDAVAVADRRARRVRGARRHLHRAGRKGRLTQSRRRRRARTTGAGLVARRRAARLALRRERRIPAHDRRPVRAHQAARHRAADVRRTISNLAWSPNGKTLLARGQSSRTCGRSTSRPGARRRSIPTRTHARPRLRRRRGRPTHAGSRTRRASTAICARSSCTRSPTAKPHASHRRSRRRRLARVRRERQVSLFPREHRLRPAHRLGRDERRRSSRAPLGLSRGAERERAVAVAARGGRRACRRRCTARAKPDSVDARRPRGHQSENTQPRHSGRRLQPV